MKAETRFFLSRIFVFVIAALLCASLLPEYVVADDEDYYFPDITDNTLIPLDEYKPDDISEEDMLLEEETEESEQSQDETPFSIAPFLPERSGDRSLPAKCVANAYFFRSIREHIIEHQDDHSLNYGCMQNFALFKKNNDTYFVRSMGGGISAKATVYIERRSVYGNTSLTFGSEFYNSEGYPNPLFQYTGHGENIEIVEHQGHTYALTIEGHRRFVKRIYINGEWKDKYRVVGPYKLSMIELLFDENGSITLGEKRSLDLFNTYGDDNIPSVESKLATSENYLCISISYGTTRGVKNDRERYMIYNKHDLVQAMLNGAHSQRAASVQNCRYATGWFTGDDSIGMEVDFHRAVVQCLALDEKKDSSGNLTNFIVLAAIDDRGTGGDEGTNGRKDHYITRAFLTPKSPGSSASRAAQNMKSNSCYYSKITHISYTGSSGTLEHSLNSSPGGLTSGRTELEGLKKIANQGNGIPAGWYISTHNHRFTSRRPKITPVPYYGSLPSYTSGSVPWNSMIYKVQMTPVASWPNNN